VGEADLGEAFDGTFGNLHHISRELKANTCLLISEGLPLQKVTFICGSPCPFVVISPYQGGLHVLVLCRVIRMQIDYGILSRQLNKVTLMTDNSPALYCQSLYTGVPGWTEAVNNKDATSRLCISL
jgi:hypothetical protein